MLVWVKGRGVLFERCRLNRIALPYGGCGLRHECSLIFAQSLDDLTKT